MMSGGRLDVTGRGNSYLPGPPASRAARIMRLTVGRRAGQASIRRVKSGSICVSRAKDWAHICGGTHAFDPRRLHSPRSHCGGS